MPLWVEKFCFLRTKKVACLPSSKHMPGCVLNQDTKLLPHKWWHISWFFRSFRPVGKQRKKTGLHERKKKGGLKILDKQNKTVEKGWVLFWHCTGLVCFGFFKSNSNCFLTITSTYGQSVIKKESLSQHCSSDRSWVQISLQLLGSMGPVDNFVRWLWKHFGV